MKGTIIVTRLLCLLCHFIPPIHRFFLSESKLLIFKCISEFCSIITGLFGMDLHLHVCLWICIEQCFWYVVCYYSPWEPAPTK